MYEWGAVRGGDPPGHAVLDGRAVRPARGFIGTDRGSFNQWWLDVHGCYYHPYADELYEY